MGIGASVFLLAVGAILTFAVGQEQVGTFNISIIGVILMVAGALGLLLTMLMSGRLTRGVGVAEERVITRERDVY